jgi:hypothetical protein
MASTDSEWFTEYAAVTTWVSIECRDFRQGWKCGSLPRSGCWISHFGGCFYLSQLFRSNLSSEILEARVRTVVMRRLRISVLELLSPVSRGDLPSSLVEVVPIDGGIAVGRLWYFFPPTRAHIVQEQSLTSEIHEWGEGEEHEMPTHWKFAWRIPAIRTALECEISSWTIDVWNMEPVGYAQGDRQDARASSFVENGIECSETSTNQE